MTTEVNPLPLQAKPAPRRQRLANDIMGVASRLGMAEPEIRGLAMFIREGDHVIDIGASHGMYTVPLSHLVGASGAVHSFEPHPRQQRTLRRLRRLLGADQVDINDAAVGSAEGEFTMRLPVRYGLPIYGHAHIADGAAQYAAGVKTHTWRTPMTSVDAFVARTGLSSVSFIKVDVEGFEPEVVSGAETTITAFLPSLLLEIEDRHLLRYGKDANTFADEIRSRWPEYRMYVWANEAWVLADKVILGTRNYLFATDAAFDR